MCCAFLYETHLIGGGFDIWNILLSLSAFVQDILRLYSYDLFYRLLVSIKTPFSVCYFGVFPCYVWTYLNDKIWLLKPYVCRVVVNVISSILLKDILRSSLIRLKEWLGRVYWLWAWCMSVSRLNLHCMYIRRVWTLYYW